MNISNHDFSESYVASSDIIDFINGTYAGTSVNYGKRVVGSLTKHLARKRLLREEIDLDLPEDQSPVVRTDDGELLHVALLDYSLDSQSSIEGLSEEGRLMIQSFVRDHLPQEESASELK